jgi:hypothetical protein
MMQFFSIVCAVRETCEPLGWGFRPFTYPNVRADLRQGQPFVSTGGRGAKYGHFKRSFWAPEAYLKERHGDPHRGAIEM